MVHARNIVIHLFLDRKMVFFLYICMEFLMFEEAMIGEFPRSPSKIRNLLSLLGLYMDDYLVLGYIPRIEDAMYLGELIGIFGCLQG